ncbi:MAG: hypothetical protein JWP25_3609 [Bradyrhizobium sp.]|nr:hypothetical protein [Bradyrhizobium sp.]
MQLTLRSLSLKVRLIAGVVTALVAGGGALAAINASPFALASHAYVNDRVDSALQIATTRIGSLQRESGETRLQLNRLRREGLRNARWNLGEQLKFASDASTRRVLQERIEQIDDDLRDVDKERDNLKAFLIP